jgi:type VI protein secretion system component Hcp
MKVSRTSLMVAVTAITLAIAAPAMAAIYIKFDGVDGEAATGGRQIEISSANWSSPLRTEGCSGSAGGGRVMLSGAGLSGLAIPPTGQHVKRAVMHIRKAAEKSEMVITLEDSLVTSLTGGSAARPTGQVSLSYARVSWVKEGCR